MGVPTKDKTTATGINNVTLLTQSELEVLYLSGLPRRYVDAVADDMLRHQVTIKLGGDATEDTTDLVTSVETFLKETQFHQALSEVVKLQRLYGGAVLVLLIDDGLPPEEPVDPKRIRGIRGYVPLSRWECLPQDFSILDYSRPSHYLITTSQRITNDQETPYVNIKIHSSRVARFDGLYLPWKVRVRNTGWGQSCLQLIWDAFKRYESALSGLESMATDADVFVHKVPGLFNRLAAGGENDMRKRLEANSLSRSIYGGMVVDKEEEISFLNRTLSNLASATDPFVKDLQAATGWPASILMGDSPGGLGKEGRFEERVWASIVEQWQEVYCRTPITEVLTYVLASREGPTRGRIPEAWSVEFPSVFTETDREKADIRAVMAGVDLQYINSGVLNALEVRESRFGGTEFSIDTKLDGDITSQMEELNAAQTDQQMAGIEAQMQASQAPYQQQQQQEADMQAPQGDSTEGGSVILPTPTNRGDSVFDTYSAHGLRIHVTHSAGDVRAGHLVGPDGQRTDSSQNAPLMVFGPNRTRSYRLYRARFSCDGALVDGPYVTGFSTLRQARQGVAKLWPGQTVAGLSPVPDSEIEALRAGWDTY